MGTTLKNTRNLSLECFKLLAACFVVFLHIPFPGTFGQLTVCLSRFAVPLFFAVSYQWMNLRNIYRLLSETVRICARVRKNCAVRCER